MTSSGERAPLRFYYVEREPIYGVIDGVDFGLNLWCVARSPTAALFWDAGHSYTSGQARQYGQATLIAWRRRDDGQGHRAYRRLGHDGGRLTHDRLLAVGEAIAELFGSPADPRDFELMNWVARAAGRPARTLLIDGGGQAFQGPHRQNSGREKT